MYADDTDLKFSNKKDYFALANQSALLDVSDCLEKNKLTLNVRTNQDFELLSFKKSEKRSVKCFLHDTQKEDVECFKYLGIHPDCKLSFHQHIDKVENKVLQFCGMFFHLRKFLNGQQLIFAYKSYVQPIIQYGVLIYAITDKTKLLELEMKIRSPNRINF